MSGKSAWLLVAIVALSALVPPPCIGSEIPLATDAPQPLPPSESLKRFQVEPGFHIDLVASEPHLADPVAMAFDAQGRIFVCEIHGYNLEGYLDVLQLNRSGVLDKEVRRIAANPEAIKQAASEQYGTVKLLEDLDADGRIDRATVWADRLPPSYGVIAARDGVIVLCAPDIVYLADRDGDGKAEVHERLFTGFGTYDLWSRISSPRWGLDNWIYAVNGIESGGTITGPHLAQPVKLDATCFRFKPDGSRIEPSSGASGGFGQAINDWGDRFLVTNQQHALFVAPLDYRYLARNPFYAAPNLVINISTYGHPARVYPTSQPDPWRLARSKDPAWVEFYGVAETTANGFFTAASGQCIYQADQFPSEYRGNHFSVDNAQNLIHRCLLRADGVQFLASRPPGDQTREFLTSTEQWFRPVNLVNGPDGSLYVVDMYRAIIEDYSAIPRYLQQIYIESLIAGSDKGRIYRIAAKDARKLAPFNLAAASTDSLIDQLASANVWWRETAQRLLLERGDRAAVARLASLARTGTTPQARLHAMYTLDGLDALEPSLVAEALGDSHFAVRLHALRLAERWFGQEPAKTGSSRAPGSADRSRQFPADPRDLVEKITRMADDPEPRVRLQVALSLGETRDPRAAQTLARLVLREGDDRWMQAAILSSAAGSAGQLLHELLLDSQASDQHASLVHALASVVGASHDDQQITAVLSSLSASAPPSRTGLQIGCLEGLLEGLRRGRANPLQSTVAQQSLRRLLGHADKRVQQLAIQMAGVVRFHETPEMKSALAEAEKTALDPDGNLTERLAAVALLTAAPVAQFTSLVESLLDPRQPLELQLAAMRAASAVDDVRMADVLLARWSVYTPTMQTAAIESLFGWQNHLPKLLDAIEAGKVGVASLDLVRREQLLASRDAKIRDRARQLLAVSPGKPDRAQVLQRYQAALTKPRDAARGKKVYESQCAKCHALEGQGYVVGPDLASVLQRSDEMLVSDVLDPSNQITVGYNHYTVITDDGRIFTGILAAETATSVTLKREQAAEDVILRKNIEEMAASTISMMPENLDKEVTPQDVADLITYLRKALRSSADVARLFDDEPAFPASLVEGDGRVWLETADRFVGTACLRVAPPQRFNARIPGWEYRIREKPLPGEYRYLRFAWKSLGADGLMIELAGQGQWPPPNQPQWRYCCGANRTGWNALQIDAELPRQWTVITRDLWKDFGNFTLTGIAPTATGGDALFDQIQLLRSLDNPPP